MSGSAEEGQPILSDNVVQQVKNATAKARQKTVQAEEAQKHAEKLDLVAKDQFGSRAVGGQRPVDEVLYGTIESADYLVPDTKEEEAHQRTFTPAMRNRRRLFIWWLYGGLAAVVAASIVLILHLCDVILKERVKPTAKALAEVPCWGCPHPYC